MTYTHTSLAAQPKGVGETCCHFLSFLLTLNFKLKLSMSTNDADVV